MHRLQTLFSIFYQDVEMPERIFRQSINNNKTATLILYDPDINYFKFLT